MKKISHNYYKRIPKDKQKIRGRKPHLIKIIEQRKIIRINNTGSSETPSAAGVSHTVVLRI